MSKYILVVKKGVACAGCISYTNLLETDVESDLPSQIEYFSYYVDHPKTSERIKTFMSEEHPIPSFYILPKYNWDLFVEGVGEENMGEDIVRSNMNPKFAMKNPIKSGIDIVVWAMDVVQLIEKDHGYWKKKYLAMTKKSAITSEEDSGKNHETGKCTCVFSEMENIFIN